MSFIVLPLPPRRAAVAGSRACIANGAEQLRFADGDLLVRQDAGRVPWRPTMPTVTVQDGTVDLWGLVHSVEEKKAAQLAAETIPGVRAVVNNIIVQRVGYGWS